MCSKGCFSRPSTKSIRITSKFVFLFLLPLSLSAAIPKGWLPLEKNIQESFQITISHDYEKESIRLKEGPVLIELQAYQSYFTLNGLCLRLNDYPAIAKEDWIVSEKDLKKIKAALLFARQFFKQKNPSEEKKEPAVAQTKAQSPGVIPLSLLRKSQARKIDTIILDAGHGGKDPGAIAYGFNEKDLTLMVTKALRVSLTNSLDEGIQVILTRSDDRFLELEERCQIANQLLGKDKQGLFISIHLNRWFLPETRGMEIYYLAHSSDSQKARTLAWAENKPYGSQLKKEEAVDYYKKIFGKLQTIQYQRESKRIAEVMLDEVLQSMPDYTISRGVKAELFYVLKGALMPSVLIEVGFISNREDLMYINNPEKLKLMCDSLAKGIEKFVLGFESSHGFVTDPFVFEE